MEIQNVPFIPVAIIVIYSLVLHKLVQGYIAYRLGDTGIKEHGHLSFNPKPRISIIKTLIVPLACLLFTGGVAVVGMAKPIPINTHRLRFPRLAPILIAIAGPAVYFLLAGVFSLLFHIPVLGTQILRPDILLWGIFMNLLLGIINCMPIPPMDGSILLTVFLPRQQINTFAHMQKYGLFMVLGFLVFSYKAIWSLVAFLLINVYSIDVKIILP